MFSLQANIGDVVAMTFVESENGVIGEELINDRKVYLDRKSAGLRPSDTCLVKICGENRRRTVYFVTVEKVVVLGDGKRSLLQYACDAVNWHYALSLSGSAASGGLINLTPGVRLIERTCSGDKVRMLGELVKLSAAYHYDFEADCKPSDYIIDASALVQLANSILKSLPYRCQDLVRDTCLALADSCFDRFEFGPAEIFLRLALAYSTPDSEQHSQALLDLSAAVKGVADDLRSAEVRSAIDAMGLEINLFANGQSLREWHRSNLL